MKFTNRTQELKRLDHLTKLSEASVAVIWGRRRVGKTRLLLNWVEKHRGVYYVADESAASIQRKYFSSTLDEALPGFSEVDYPDWNVFFTQLAKRAILAKWRGPIVIDELPYLIATSPELPSILQTFIDHEAKKACLIIVFCGSSQRMMQDAILKQSAPLYGRADELIKLTPLTIYYMKEALHLKMSRDVIEFYSIWGGIPRYWELLERNPGTLLEGIEKLVLDPMGPLNDESSRILLEEKPSAMRLKPILDAIGLGANRLSEIASRIGQTVTGLSRPLQQLIELDLIQKEIPYGASESNSKKTLYKIKDPFMRFWFESIAPRRSFFAQGSPLIRMEWIKESLSPLFSLMWEDLCRLAVPLLSKHLNGNFFLPAGRFWQGQDFEWDILSQSHTGDYFLVGEAKWTAKAPSLTWVYKVIQELKNKGLPPVQRPDKIGVLYVLFVAEKPPGLILPEDVKVIDATEVIEAFQQQ